METRPYNIPAHIHYSLCNYFRADPYALSF